VLTGLCARPHLRAALGRRARERARAFSPARMAYDYLRAYQDLIGALSAVSGEVQPCAS
jgi:hypothetical protein